MVIHDVIVIGGGLAGMRAAIEAVWLGCNVAGTDSEVRNICHIKY